jgi:replication-associated recombination protein RarA
MQLSEEYRPKSLSEVIGQPAAVRVVERVLARGWGGRAWWITGASGTGKTTIAKIVAAQGASDLSTEEHVAGSLTPAGVREIEAAYRNTCLPMRNDPLRRCGWAIIVNEAHGLAKNTVRALLDALERIPKHACWIFTTTLSGQQSFFEDDVDGDAAPLVSRCQLVKLVDTDESRRELAARAKAIAQSMGADGLPDELYLWALNSVHGNMRALLQRIESGQLAATASEFAVQYLQQPFSHQNPATRERVQALLAVARKAG